MRTDCNLYERIISGRIKWRTMIEKFHEYPVATKGPYELLERALGESRTSIFKRTAHTCMAATRQDKPMTTMGLGEFFKRKDRLALLCAA
jgi:hypothetical protein